MLFTGERESVRFCKIYFNEYFDISGKEIFQVVRLNSECECAQFLCVLSSVLNRANKHLIIRRCPISYITEIAETSERRQEKLDHFFREAYAKVITLSQLISFITNL